SGLPPPAPSRDRDDEADLGGNRFARPAERATDGAGAGTRAARSLVRPLAGGLDAARGASFRPSPTAQPPTSIENVPLMLTGGFGGLFWDVSLPLNVPVRRPPTRESNVTAAVPSKFEPPHILGFWFREKRISL